VLPPADCIWKCTLTTAVPLASKRGNSAKKTGQTINTMDRKMNKMLTKHMAATAIKKKKVVTFADDVMGFALPGAQAKKKPSVGAVRRAGVLSSMLLPYVRGMVDSGEIDARLSELGFMVEEVQVKSDLSQINILWQMTGTDKDALIKEILLDAAHTLRRSLTGLHLMGRLPPIFFICSSGHSRQSQIDELLQSADMGPDFVPTDLAEELKRSQRKEKSIQDIFSDLTTKFVDKDSVNTEDQSEDELAEVPPRGTDAENSKDIEQYLEQYLGSNEEAKVSSEDESSKDSILQNEKIPQLRSDVYGVNHADLVQKILSGNVRKNRSVQDPVILPTPQIDVSSLRKNILPKPYQLKPPSKEKYLSMVTKELRFVRKVADISHEEDVQDVQDQAVEDEGYDSDDYSDWSSDYADKEYQLSYDDRYSSEQDIK